MNNCQNDASDDCLDHEAAQWKAARDELANLVNYGPNWDGEGAIPIRTGLLAATLRLFQLLEPINLAPSDLYLAPDGTVVAEWHLPAESVTIVNVRVADHAEVTNRTIGKAPQFSNLPIPPIGDGPPVASSLLLSVC